MNCNRCGNDSCQSYDEHKLFGVCDLAAHVVAMGKFESVKDINKIRTMTRMNDFMLDRWPLAFINVRVEGS